MLAHQIDSGLFARQGVALTNFHRTLPAEQSELAQQLIKDPYSFDFLSLAPEARERALEQGLLQQVRAPILELGKGFAFVGSQYPLEVGGQDSMGVAQYRLSTALPEQLRKDLPTVEDLAAVATRDAQAPGSPTA